MRGRAVWNDAFLICHEIYRSAREVVNSRIATTQLQSTSKYLWRPDLKPRLVEFIADFARAGERALGEMNATSSAPHFRDCRTPKGHGNRGAFGAKNIPRASRLILFRMYYLGGAEYEAARRVLGLSERTWSDWAEEIRAYVGRELIRAGMYPPAKYFKQPFADRPFANREDKKPAPDPAASTNGNAAETIPAVPHEPDFA